jgi:AraC-like DNA-binding protein
LRTILEEQLASLESDLSSGLADDIRRMLRTRLTSNRCSADRVAGSLTMHRRTLSRRLSGEGAGFRALTNEIRFETACQLLDDTQIPLGQIAAALGYSEASAFSRAFRRWSGRTPTAWRAKCHPGSRTLAA